MCSMNVGERYDFILNANQTSGYYWIYVRGLGECELRGVYQLALLVYKGSSESTLSSRPNYSNVPQNDVGIVSILDISNCTIKVTWQYDKVCKILNKSSLNFKFN